MTEDRPITSVQDEVQGISEAACPGEGDMPDFHPADLFMAAILDDLLEKLGLRVIWRDGDDHPYPVLIDEEDS